MPARRALATGAGQGVGLAVAGELAATLPFDVTSWEQTSEAAGR